MPDYSELSSEELMPLVGAGDRDAFACLLSRHMDMVYRVAFRHVGNDAEAEDISQEVFLRVWRKADSYARQVHHLALRHNGQPLQKPTPQPLAALRAPVRHGSCGSECPRLNSHPRRKRPAQ